VVVRVVRVVPVVRREVIKPEMRRRPVRVVRPPLELPVVLVTLDLVLGQMQQVEVAEVVVVVVVVVVENVEDVEMVEAEVVEAQLVEVHLAAVRVKGTTVKDEQSAITRSVHSVWIPIKDMWWASMAPISLRVKICNFGTWA